MDDDALAVERRKGPGVRAADIEARRRPLAGRRADDAGIDEAGAGVGDRRRNGRDGRRRDGVAVGEDRPFAGPSHGGGGLAGESGSAGRRQDRQDKVGFGDGGVELAAIGHAGRCGAGPAGRAAAFERGDDAVAMLAQGAADGVAHIARCDHGDGLE